MIQGQVQPGARISVRSTDRQGPERAPAATSADDGTFLLAHLTPGTYIVSVELAATRMDSEELTLLPGETLELHAVVTPIGFRIATNEAQPAPTAPLPDEDDDGLVSERGLTAMQNGTFLDGTTLDQSFGARPAGTGSDPAPDPDGDSDAAEISSGPANGLARGRHAGVAYVFSQAAVREFRVAGRDYSAQSGRAGEVATTVSRSGSDKLHGSGFFVLRSQAFAASSPLATATSYLDGVITSAEVKPHDLRENFGATLGGPVPKVPTAFFFYTIDRQQRGFPAISSPADPNFYSLSATQSALLARRGVTPAGINGALDYVSSLTGSTPRRADQTLNFGRLDLRPRPGMALALEYNAVRWNSPAGLIDAPVVARGRASLGTAAGSLDLVQLRATQTASPHTTNQARLAYLRDEQYETPQTPLPQEPAIGPGGLAPEVNIGPNGLLFGTPATLSQQAYPDEQRVQLADTLTLIRGRHLMVAGGELALVNDRVATLANAAGAFRYDSGATGGYAGGLVDFLTDYTFSVNAYPSGGCPSITAVTHLSCFRSFSQSFGEQSVAFSTQDWSGFVEDTWRPRPRLTLRAGLRYEYTRLPAPSAPNSTLDALFGSRGATSAFPEDRNNLGPRAALSWEPFGSGRGVVRAGFGVFYGRLPGATIQSALSDTAQPGSTTRIRIRPSIATTCPQAPTQGFGYPCAFLTQPPAVVATTTSAMVFDRRFRLPMVQQGSLSLEREVRRGARLTAAYVFNLDRQLPGSTDLNIAPSTSSGRFQLQGGTGAPGVQDGETFVLPVYTARVSSSFGPVTDITSHVNATYHGLTVAADAKPSTAVRVHGDLTWSKAIDFGQNQSATPRTDSQFDPFSNGYDKGLSSLNYPWALRAMGTWLPVLQPGPAWLRHAANGWDFAPILTARSGRPYSLDLSGGTLLPGGHESLNASGGALYLPTVGRNTLRLPAAVQVNLRAQREFRINRRMRLQTAVEAFNLFNHRNVSSVEERAYLVGASVGGVTPLVFQNAAAIAAEGLNVQPFGTPTSAATSLARERQIQLSVRLEF
jgi:hypothetical protein